MFHYACLRTGGGVILRVVFMKKMPLFLGVALAALTLASCEKELEQVDSSPKSSSAAATLAKPDLLTTGSWRQTGLSVSTAGEGTAPATTADLFARARPSMLVKSAIYKSDGTFTLLRGPRPGQQTTEPMSGTWRLTSSADSLILTQDDHTRRFAVAELTATTLRITHSEGGAGKGPVYTSVFSR
jgi:hypothetical protein